jgi:hypothetical protein
LQLRFHPLPWRPRELLIRCRPCNSELSSFCQSNAFSSSGIKGSAVSGIKTVRTVSMPRLHGPEGAEVWALPEVDSLCSYGLLITTSQNSSFDTYIKHKSWEESKTGPLRVHIETMTRTTRPTTRNAQYKSKVVASFLGSGFWMCILHS